jgi:hypothetical protein
MWIYDPESNVTQIPGGRYEIRGPQGELLGCDAEYSGRRLPKSLRNLLHPPSTPNMERIFSTSTVVAEMKMHQK